MFISRSARRLTAALLAALLTLIPALPAAADQAPAQTGTVTVRGSAVSADLPAYSLDDYTHNEALAVTANGDCRVFSYADRQALAAGIQALQADPDVAFVQPNFRYEKTAVPNDPYFAQQWAFRNSGSFSVDVQETYRPYALEEASSGLIFDDDVHPDAVWDPTILEHAVAGEDIKMAEAWDLYRPQRQAVVALIDTGVDMTHPDLPAASFWTNTDEIPDNGIDDDGNGYVDDVHGWDFYYSNNTLSTGTQDAHGTHGAGSIAAARGNGLGIAGIGGDGSVRIMPLKVLGGSSGTGTTANVIKAIHYAEQNGAAICNLSMGADTLDVALYLAMANSNMLFVVSAGNDGYNTDRVPSYPASFDLDNVLAVANMKPDGKLHPTSNYGASTVDLAAPGTAILSTSQGGGYTYMTGTSMAAPIVSGVCAMVYASSDALSPRDVARVIRSTVAKSAALQGRVATGGCIDAQAALAKVHSMRANAGSYTTSGSLPFTDVPSSSIYYPAISAMYRAGLMRGTGAASFSPDQPLNRGTVITILGRLAKAPTSTNTAFTDVRPGDWYAGYINWGADAGILFGYGDGRFGPLDAITAEQMDAILSRYARLIGRTYSSGLAGKTILTRAQTAAALYDFCVALDIPLQ
jgi:hypothetical protein